MKKHLVKFNEKFIAISFFVYNFFCKTKSLILALLLTALMSNKATADLASMIKTTQTQAEAGASAAPIIFYTISIFLVAAGIFMIFKKGKDQHSQTGWGAIALCLVGGALLACVTFVLDTTAESVGAEVSK
jgi:drug/metabolite transporter (DMT)-like permease